MDWFKSYNGAPIDPKFQLIAHKAKLKVYEISLCWWVLMDHASGSANRGDVSNIDFESLDFFFQFEPGTFERAFSAFVERGMIIDEQISNWKKRQTNDSADRQRRYRENKKAKVDNVTDADNECDALRNVTNASLEEKRGEEIRRDKKEDKKEEDDDFLNYSSGNNKVDPIKILGQVKFVGKDNAEALYPVWISAHPKSEVDSLIRAAINSDYDANWIKEEVSKIGRQIGSEADDILLANKMTSELGQKSSRYKNAKRLLDLGMITEEVAKRNGYNAV